MNSSFPKFTFNELDSYNDLGIIIKEMTPIILPERDVESLQVEGSNRILHIDKGAYKAINVKMKCSLWDVSKIDVLKQLFKADGEIEFSDEPGRIYKCRNTNQIEFARFKGLTGVRDFTLNFELEPIAYGIEETLTFEDSDSFEINGSEDSNPIITVIGTGILSLNGIQVEFLESGITLDCEHMEAYSDSLSKNDKVILDEFPTLSPGENNLVIPNTITNVSISYRERWL